MESETENNRLKPLREAILNVGSLSDRRPPLTCPDEVAAKRAAILLGCYRKGDAEEPEIYAAALASVLASYPQEVSYRVTDPRTGIAGRSKWLPTVAEVREACEAEMAPYRAEEARKARREATEAVLASPPLRRIAKSSFEELSAALEERYKQNGKPKPFSTTLFEVVDAFAGKPLVVSDRLAAKIAAAQTELQKVRAEPW
jgi:hypothetical protein